MVNYSTIKAKVAGSWGRIFRVAYHFVIPSKANGQAPYVLGSFSFGVLAVLGAALIFLPAGSRSLQFALLSGEVEIKSERIIALVNTARNAAGLAPLRENQTLAQSATAKARDIFEDQYFAHIAPDGTSPWQLFRSAGYDYKAAGENLALDFLTAEEAHDALMKSPTHRANILNTLYSEVGVAVVRGVFNGRPSIVIVEHFGNPMLRAVSPRAEASAGTEGSEPRTEVPEKPVGDTESRGTELGQAEEKIAAFNAEDEPSLEKSYPRVVPLGEHWGTIVVRLAATVVVLVVLIAFALGIMRGVLVNHGLVLRTLTLVFIFGYITAVGVGEFSFAALTPHAFFTVNAGEVVF